MKKLASAKWVAAAAVMVLVAGSVVLGSNMGFKFNAPLDVDGGNPPPAGDNRISLPLLNPYVDAEGLCQQLGLSSALGAEGRVQQFQADLFGVGGFSGSHFCGNAASNYVLQQGLGVRILDDSVTSAIIVGSHDPSFVVNLVGRTAGFVPPYGNNEVSLPYHSTAVTTADVCADVGPNALSVSEFDPDGPAGLGFGQINTFNCGAAGDFTLTLGRSLVIVTSADTAWVPSHF